MGNQNLPMPSAKQQYTEEQLKELVKCAEDILHFAQNYFFITTEDGKQKIELYKHQKRILKALIKNRFCCILQPRQSGKTTTTSIYALWTALFSGDKNILIVANKEDTAKMILSRIRMAYEQLPNWLKSGVKKWGDTSILFGNDSMIDVSTTTISAGVGNTVHLLIIDEAARILPNIIEPFWDAIIPVISAGKKSKIFMSSTAFGTQGKFYEIWSRCERGELKEWHQEKADWWEIPGRNEKWKNDMVAALGSQRSFDQEFGNCFLSNDTSAINTTLLDEFRTHAKTAEIVLEDGDYSIWEPPQPGHIYSFGVDVSEGIGRASSVIQIIDITDLTNIKQCAIYHSNKIDPYKFANKVFEISQQWGNPHMIIERNNCGAQTIDVLHNTYHMDNLITHLPKGQVGESGNFNKLGSRLGVYSHTTLRLKAIVNMRYWLNNMKVVTITDIGTVQEFDTFVQHSNNIWGKKNGESYFDDRVMALVWALFALENEITEQYYNIDLFDNNGKPLKISYLDPTNFKITPQGNNLAAMGQETPMPAFMGFKPPTKNFDDMDMNDLVMAGWKPA